MKTEYLYNQQTFYKIGHNIDAVKNLLKSNAVIRNQLFQVHLKVCSAPGAFQAHPIRRIKGKITGAESLFRMSALPANQIVAHRSPTRGAGHDAGARVQHAKHTQYVGLCAHS